MSKRTIECPHCHVPGVIYATEDVDGVIPKEVLCGNCRERFLFHPSWIDRVASETWPGQNVYYLRPNYRPDPTKAPEESPEPTTAERLANIAIHRIVTAYKKRRNRQSWNDQVWIQGRAYSSEEVKKVLDHREHVPKKKR